MLEIKSRYIQQKILFYLTDYINVTIIFIHLTKTFNIFNFIAFANRFESLQNSIFETTNPTIIL
jgi:hypothetical protein